MSKYLLVTRSSIEVVESEPLEIWRLLVDIQYPADFISLTVMEQIEGAY